MDTIKLVRHSRAGLVLVGLFSTWPVLYAASADEIFRQESQLTLARLIEFVLIRNPDVSSMQATWSASQARSKQVGAFDDPQVSYSIAPQTIGKNNQDFGQKITISQRLPWPGKLGLKEDIARLLSNATREDIARVRLRLTLRSQIAYADWYFVHAALRINAINQSLLQEFQRIAEIKYAAGRTSKQDVLRAEVEAALLDHRDILLQGQRREVLSVINTLLHRTPDLSLPPPSEISTLNDLPPVLDLRRKAINNHPELRALKARIRASRQRQALSKRDFYPDFKLNAGYNSLWNQTQKRLTIGASINIPLRAKRHAASDEIRARTKQLDSLKTSKEAKILDTLQRAFEQVRENRHVLLLFSDRLLPLAEENLAAAQSDYESGRGGFLDLISAEKNLMQTQLQLEQARADYLRRRGILEHAVGESLSQATIQ